MVTPALSRTTAPEPARSAEPHAAEIMAHPMASPFGFTWPPTLKGSQQPTDLVHLYVRDIERVRDHAPDTTDFGHFYIERRR